MSRPLVLLGLCLSLMACGSQTTTPNAPSPSAASASPATSTNGTPQDPIASFKETEGFDLDIDLGFPGGASALALNGDGTKIAAAKGTAISIRDAQANLREIARLQEPRSDVTALAISPDGSMIASCSETDTAHLWNTSTGALLHTFSRQDVAVEALAFSPDGKTLALGREDGSIELVDPTTRAKLNESSAESGGIQMLIFSPDSSTLAAATLNDKVFVFDRATGKRKASFDSGSSPMMPLAALSFTADGKNIWTGLSQQSLMRFDAKSGKRNASKDLLDSKIVQDGPIFVHAFAPNGTLAAAGRTNMLELWSLDKGAPSKALTGISGTPITAAFSGDGKRLASSLDTGEVGLWSTANGQNLGRFGDARPIRSVSFAPRRGDLAVAEPEGALHVIFRGSSWPEPVLTFPADTVFGVYFSPDERSLLTLESSPAGGYFMRLLALNKGKLLQKFEGFTALPGAVQFTPDGKRIVLADSYGFGIVDVQTGKVDRKQNLVTAAGQRFAISDDAKYLAKDGPSNIIEVWEVEKGQKVVEFKGHTAEITALSFSPLDYILASGSGDKSIRLWNVVQKQPNWKLMGHEGKITALAFADDGTALFSGGEDKTVRAWDLLVGREKAKWVGAMPTSMSVSKKAVAWTTGGDRMYLAPDTLKDVWTLYIPRGGKGVVVRGKWEAEARGSNLEAARQLLICREGARSYPFAYCEKYFGRVGVVEDALRGIVRERAP